MRKIRVAIVITLGVFFAVLGCKTKSNKPQEDWIGTGPKARLIKASKITFPAETDSNSPSFWLNGEFRLFNSSGHPTLSVGPSLTSLTSLGPVTFNNTLPGRRWMEEIITDTGSRVYGIYHYEPSVVCPGIPKTAPSIGMARSEDGGMHWTDLGFIIESNPSKVDCNSANEYFLGGVGDPSALLDSDGRFLYIYYSIYEGPLEEQGVAVARVDWAQRDRPVATMQGRLWTPSRSWSTADPDAFWGASVHFNTYLGSYVMLINQVKNAAFNSEGFFVSFSPAIDLSQPWTYPKIIFKTTDWYPQVQGLEPGSGTNRLAGKKARFFTHAFSEYEIEFEK